MKYEIARFMLILITISSCLAKDQIFNFENGILLLNSKNYEKAQLEYEKMAVLFYQNETDLAIYQFEGVANKTNSWNVPITLAKYNFAKESKKFANQHNIIENKNTILILEDAIKKGKKTGQITDQECLDFILKHGVPVEINNLNLFNNIVEIEQYLVVLFIQDLNSKTLQLFDKLRQDQGLIYYNDVKLAYTSDQETHQYYSINNEKIIIFRKFNNKQVEVPMQLTDENYNAVMDFIEANQMPLIKQFTVKIYERIFTDGNPALFFIHGQQQVINLFYHPNDHELQYHFTLITVIIKQKPIIDYDSIFYSFIGFLFIFQIYNQIRIIQINYLLQRQEGDNSELDRQNQQISEAFINAAQQIGDSIYTVQIEQLHQLKHDGHYQKIRTVLDYLHINLQKPSVFILDHSNFTKRLFYIKDMYSTDEIINNFQQFKYNELTPFIYSESLWESQKTDNVQYVVGSNFHEIVYDETKHVFVNYFSHLCGRINYQLCLQNILIITKQDLQIFQIKKQNFTNYFKQIIQIFQFEPVLKEVAEMLKDRDDILIANFNLLKNDHLTSYVKKYPTQRLFMIGKKNKPKKLNYDKKPPSAKEIYEWILSYIDYKNDNIVEQEEPNEQHYEKNEL